MKPSINFLIVIFFVCINYSVNAQESSAISQNTPEAFKARSPLYDFTEYKLNNTDSIPDFESKQNICPTKLISLILEQLGISFQVLHFNK